MKVSHRVRRTTAVGAATLGLLAGSTLFGVSGAGAQLPEGEAYAFTGEAQDYLVPDGVCVVEIVAAGAQGGTWAGEGEGGPPLPGGAGGVATSEVTVTPGETLQVNVGGQGADGGEAGMGLGGWNGGGNGGTGFGGGGGGASDVRQGGTSLDDRVVVGGGGGGVGVDAHTDMAPEYGVPGVGGNPATPGGDEPPSEGDYIPAQGGGAGTDTAGGAGGDGYRWPADGEGPDEQGADGEAGVLGIGGDGADTDPEGSIGGGGGGGGLYGGGGGGIGDETSDGSGGGGSSLGDVTDAGANEGAGSVSIIPVEECAPETTTTTAPPTTVAPVVDSTVRPAPAARPVAASPAYTG